MVQHDRWGGTDPPEGPAAGLLHDQYPLDQQPGPEDGQDRGRRRVAGSGEILSLRFLPVLAEYR